MPTDLSETNEAFAERLQAIFADEARTHLAMVYAGLAGLTKISTQAPTRGATQAALVLGLQEALHTLKGAARAIGLGELEYLCDALETAIAAPGAGGHFSAARLAQVKAAADRAGQLLAPPSARVRNQAMALAENGCDEMQGYFFSRPVDADACGRLLRERASLDLGSVLRQPYARTLLYVDDEVNLLAAVTRSMRHKGCQVLAAASAAEAFEILATVEVGVILCDQRMPGMSGTEFLSRVKHMYPDVTRMVLSGYTDLQSVTDAVNHGAIFKFLTKPWDEDTLAGAVRDGFAAHESKRTAPRGAARA